MHRLALIIFIILAWGYLFSQPATITLLNGVSRKVLFKSVSEIQLFTETDTYGLQVLKAIYFREESPDSLSIYYMRAAGVTVYLKNSRLPAFKPAKENEDNTSTLPENAFGIMAIGIGMGLDYGGFGSRITITPGGPVGLFMGLGYNLDELSYNVGTEIRFNPQKRSTVILTGMYGYNSVLMIESTNDRKTYFGPSVGLGVRTLAKNSVKNFFTAQIIYPFRDRELRELHREGLVNYIPVLFSIGYNFAIGTK